MTKAIIDIEAVTGYPLHSWQAETFKNLSGGIPAGEMSIISAGRQAGKSYYNQHLQNFMAVFNQPAYKQMSIAKVDDAEWVTVQCNREIAVWVREQSQKYWYEHNNTRFESVFDLHAKLYTMLKLKFTP